MSSLKLKGLAHLALVASLSLGLSACFRPLHGPTASGEMLQTSLASIDVPEVQWAAGQERFGHYVRSELIYVLNGSGSDTPKRYKLDLTLRQGVSTPIVSTLSGEATSAISSGTLVYRLTSLDGSTVYTQGTATSSTSYDRFGQPFATLRAARDAEIRLAKVLAEQVRTRLAAELSTRS